MTVTVAMDRSLYVKRNQLVKTAQIDIDCCKLGSRVGMSPEAVEKKYRKLLCQGDDAACQPPIIGHWEGDRFIVQDGRHQYLATLMLGRDQIFVAQLEDMHERTDYNDRGT